MNNLVMMSKYSNFKFGINTFNTFWVMGKATIKFLHDADDDNDDLEIKITRFYIFNTQAKKMILTQTPYCEQPQQTASTHQGQNLFV